jgi:hypothetical protein
MSSFIGINLYYFIHIKLRTVQSTKPTISDIVKDHPIYDSLKCGSVNIKVLYYANIFVTETRQNFN